MISEGNISWLIRFYSLNIRSEVCRRSIHSFIQVVNVNILTILMLSILRLFYTALKLNLFLQANVLFLYPSLKAKLEFNKMELKAFRKVLFLVSNFVSNWLAENNKVWKLNGKVSS